MSSLDEPGAGRPDVSVVIPTQNRSGRLGRAIACALGQDAVDVEVVVVDDGSTDSTPYWLQQLASDRVRSVRHDSPRGLPQARNAGIAAARGRWVAFLDDDDLWSPTKLRTQLDALAPSGAAWTYATAVLVDDGLAPYGVEEAPAPDVVLDELLTQQVVPAGSSNVVVAADVLRQAGGFDESLPNLADWDLWLRLAERFPPVASDEILVACVQHRDNMHARQDLGAFFRELDRFVAKHETLRAARNVAFDERPFVHWVAEGRARANRPVSAGYVYLRDGLRHRDVRGARRAVRAFFRPESFGRPSGPRPRPAWLTAYERGPSPR